MATKKDLVEAYSFSRRRLVTAFVSGAPGGREVEPARPGRTIVGGIALAVLLVAGAAIAGVFSPTAPTDWTERDLIVSKDKGSLYVFTEETDDRVLHPVINATSATLVVGSDVEPTLIEQDVIDAEGPGTEIGILGAPSTVPTPAKLIQSGWTGCTDAGAGIRMTISSHPDVTAAPDTGLTVVNDGDIFAVISGPDGTYAYPVPKQVGRNGDDTQNLLSALDLPTDPTRVSREWLALFPTGAPLDFSSFELHGFGRPAGSGDADESGLAGRSVGDLLATSDGDQFLITDSGLLKLTDFEAKVYGNVVDPNGNLVDEVKVDRPPTAGFDDTTLTDSSWPDETPEETGLEAPCAQLVTAPDTPPVVHLATAGPETGADSVKKGEKDQVVDLGRGAYVLSGAFDDTDQGSPFVVDSDGLANPLVGEDAASLLGYGDVPEVVVPDSWIKLLGCGVNLSQAAALSPPQPPRPSRCR